MDTFQPAFFTYAAIAATTEAKDSGVFDRLPDVHGDTPAYAGAPKTITVSLFTEDGSPIPKDAIAHIGKVGSNGHVQDFATLNQKRPVVRIETTGRYVVMKMESKTPVGVDLDGYSAQSNTEN